jgi:hypothetical protein
LMADRFGLEGVREVGSRSGERRRGGATVTGRGTARQGIQRSAGGARLADGGGVMAEHLEEEDEGRGPHVNEGEEGGRLGGPTEGHWTG